MSRDNDSQTADVREAEARRSAAEDRQLARQTLFGNEQFTIATTQAVSAATAFGIVSQVDKLVELAGRMPTLVVLTGTVTALILAVLSAWFRHQHKMWDVKYRASEDDDHQVSASRNLRRMRLSMAAAALTVAGSFLVLITSMWARYLCNLAN